MKRNSLIAFILALILMLGLSVPAMAADSDFEINGSTLVKYNGSGSSVVIPNGITEIGERAFYSNKSLVKVTIPDGVTSIGDNAFAYCSNLTDVTVSESVTSIGRHAFDNCTSLTKVNIPSGVASISDYTFDGCKSLTNITIPSGVTKIGDSAFHGSGLTSVTIPGSVTSIERSAFSGCLNLASLTISEGVTNIGEFAFSSCNGLTHIILPASLTSISERTFAGCDNLLDVVIPSSVKSIENGAFSGCYSLTAFYYGGSESQWAAVEIDKGRNDVFERRYVYFNSDTTKYPAPMTFNTREIYQTLIALKNQYPEGMPWGLEKEYDWYGLGYDTTGVACSAFAYTISDTLFGKLPAKNIWEYELSDIRVGDLIDDAAKEHIVVVLEVKDNGVVVAEGNYGGKVHWGRTLTKEQVLNEGEGYTARTLVTRYPANAVITDGSAPAQPVAPTVVGFTDVTEGAWYADPVKWAVEKKITAGTSATTFSPNDTCTTAQILTFLWRAKGEPAPTIDNPFSDVKESDYYYKAALWACENGLVSGGSFSGTAPCTRAQTVTYQWKLAGSPDAPASGFTDVSASADYATAVAWAVQKGVTSGTSATKFSPNDTCTRAQIVTFLYRDLA